MSHGFKVGDRVENISRKGWGLSIGDHGTILGRDTDGLYLVEFDYPYAAGHNGNSKIRRRPSKDGACLWMQEDQLKTVEDSVEKRSFRNGDIIKVHPKGKDARAYLKMGDAYYNLSTGGYLKPSRSLPKGPSEVVVNLSGMGDYFLMPPDQVMREREDLVYVGDLVRVTDTEGHSFEEEDIVRCVEWEEGDIPLFEREDDHLRQYLELNQFEILDVDE